MPPYCLLSKNWGLLKPFGSNKILTENTARKTKQWLLYKVHRQLVMPPQSPIQLNPYGIF